MAHLNLNRIDLAFGHPVRPVGQRLRSAAGLRVGMAMPGRARQVLALDEGRARGKGPGVGRPRPRRRAAPRGEQCEDLVGVGFLGRPGDRCGGAGDVVTGGVEGAMDDAELLLGGV